VTLRRGFDSSYLAKEISTMASYLEPVAALAQRSTITSSDPRGARCLARGAFIDDVVRDGGGGSGGVKNEASRADT